ncbi:MAG: 2-hydroxyacyl-CoA dehydratase family protein, partial [Dehalococcoidia bacterium]
LSGMLIDKEEHIALLRKLLAELPQRPELPPALGRLMIVGSPLDNLDLLRLVEDELGAIVVTDDTCTGTRYCYGITPSSLDGDPLEAIADRYLLGRAPCPNKHSVTRWIQCISCPYRAVGCFQLAPAPRGELAENISLPMPKRMCRFRHMLQLAASHKVEGVLVVIQKFCDVHGFDYPHVAQVFEGVGVPTQLIDVENVISPGQISTRVQAFLEMLQPVEYLIEPGILPE